MKSVHSSYFEGILQLRNPTKELMQFVEAKIEQKEGVFISKKAKVRNGWDLYLSSGRFLKALGKLLQQHFGGELVISARLFSRSRQTSKDIHRLSVLFRLPSFVKGQIITHRGDRLKILFIGKKVGAQNIETGEKMQLSYSELR